MRHDLISPTASMRLRNEVADTNLRIMLPVALRALVLLLALELEHQNFFAAILRGNRRVDASLARFVTGQQLAAVLKQSDHLAERDFRSNFGGQFGNADHVARSDAKLLS